MVQQNDGGPARKKPYRKPEVTRVELRPEEAVLGACKSSLASGPVDVCTDFLTSCSLDGS